MDGLNFLVEKKTAVGTTWINKILQVLQIIC